MPDIGQTTINCLNISDTVIFWTRDNSLESLQELLAVSHQFNWRQNLHNMPARGVIVCEEMEMLRNNEMNPGGAIYSTSLIYGRGLYDAHTKSDNLNFAGCVVDNSVLVQLPEGTDMNELMLPYAKLYRVPYKHATGVDEDEFVLRICRGLLSDQAFGNLSQFIRARFSADNKPVDSVRAQTLIQNSIEFLETFKEIDQTN